MSHKVIWKCDACGEPFEKGYRVSHQRVLPGYSYTDDGWVYPGNGHNSPRVDRGDICDACIERGVRIHPSTGIDWTLAKEKVVA